MSDTVFASSRSVSGAALFIRRIVILCGVARVPVACVFVLLRAFYFAVVGTVGAGFEGRIGILAVALTVLVGVDCKKLA